MAEDNSDEVLCLDGENHDDRRRDGELRLKVDLRLCTIAGILCSLNLLDSSILSSASVTSLLSDLDLQGNRFSVSIFIFTIASVCFQLPATVGVRVLGPRIFFAGVTFTFGLLTFCTAFVQSWQQMIAIRVLLGIAMSGIFPGLTLLISCWYTRGEQQLRYAYLQAGEVFVLATGGIVNFGLNKLDGRGGLHGWQWMFLIQGLTTCVIGVMTFWWMVDFPERAHYSFRFLDKEEQKRAVSRIQEDRGDVEAVPFKVSVVLREFLDIKIYGFAILFFLLNLVSTALSYFLPIMYVSRVSLISFLAAKAFHLVSRMGWVSIQTTLYCSVSPYAKEENYLKSTPH